MRHFLEILTYFVLTPLILTVGFFGNTTGLKVLFRKNMHKIGPIYMYRYLFIIDSLSLIPLLNTYLTTTFQIDVLVKTTLRCKIFSYFSYSITSLSQMILVYILVERFLSIRYPVESNLLREKRVQNIYLSILFVYSFLLYIDVPISFEIIKKGQGIHNTFCGFMDKKTEKITFFIGLVDRLFIPFSLMVMIACRYCRLAVIVS